MPSIDFMKELVNGLFSMSVAFIAFMVPVSQGIIVRLKDKYDDDAVIELFLEKSYYHTFNILLINNIFASFIYWFYCYWDVIEELQYWIILNIYLLIVTFIVFWVYLRNLYRFSRGGVVLTGILYDYLYQFVKHMD